MPSVRIGEKFNRLTAIRKVDNGRPGNWYEWQCDCGNKKILRGASVKWGSPASCGCLQKEKAKEAGANKRAERVGVKCRHCLEEFFVPKCRVWRSNFCSSECRSLERQAVLNDRKRNCLECGSVFYPRASQVANGQGVFCSIQCSVARAIQAAHTEEVNRKRAETMSELRITGKLTYKRGPDNPQWTGGPKAAMQRRIKNGKAKEALRRYRKANPHRVKDWSQRRKDKLTGRLARGTVRRLLRLQSSKCAICHARIDSGYHVDHIMPLFLGGKHESHNIQLLCPPCNLRKSAKHPIDYMQERGFLL